MRERMFAVPAIQLSIILMNNLKYRERHIVRIYRNPIIGRWLDSLNDQRDKDIAGKTIDFLKNEFPEIRDLLNGELIHEEVTDGDN